MADPKKLTPDFDYSYAEQLALYKEGVAKLATSQEWEIMGKRVTRANLSEMRKTIDWLEAKVALETSGRSGPSLYEGRIV